MVTNHLKFININPKGYTEWSGQLEKLVHIFWSQHFPQGIFLAKMSNGDNGKLPDFLCKKHFGVNWCSRMITLHITAVKRATRTDEEQEIFPVIHTRY